MKIRLAALAAILLVATLVLTACTPVGRNKLQPLPPASEATAVPAATSATSKTYVIASDATFPPMEMVDATKQIVGLISI